MSYPKIAVLKMKSGGVKYRFKILHVVALFLLGMHNLESLAITTVLLH